MDMKELRDLLEWPALNPDPTPLEATLVKVLKAVRHDVAEEQDEESATHAFFHTFFPLLSSLDRDYPPPLPEQPMLKGLRFKSSAGTSPLSENATGADFAIAFFDGVDGSVRLAVFQAKLEKDGEIAINQKSRTYRTRQLFDMVRLAVEGRRLVDTEDLDWADLDWVYYLGWRASAWERVLPLSQAADTIQRLHAKEATGGKTCSKTSWRLSLDPRRCKSFFKTLCAGAAPKQQADGDDNRIPGWLTVELAHAGTTWFPTLLGGLKTYFVCDQAHEEAFDVWVEAWRASGALDDSPDSAPKPRARVPVKAKSQARGAALYAERDLLLAELDEAESVLAFSPIDIARHWTEVRNVAMASRVSVAKADSKRRRLGRRPT